MAASVAGDHYTPRAAAQESKQPELRGVHAVSLRSLPYGNLLRDCAMNHAVTA